MNNRSLIFWILTIPAMLLYGALDAQPGEGWHQGLFSRGDTVLNQEFYHIGYDLANNPYGVHRITSVEVSGVYISTKKYALDGSAATDEQGIHAIFPYGSFLKYYDAVGNQLMQVVDQIYDDYNESIVFRLCSYYRDGMLKEVIYYDANPFGRVAYPTIFGADKIQQVQWFYRVGSMENFELKDAELFEKTYSSNRTLLYKRIVDQSDLSLIREIR